jgi:tetratricopeptide (TPR) repeat protein
MTIALFMGLAVPCPGQFQAPLEAEAPEEFDHYLTVEGLGEAAGVVAESEAYRKRWPESKLLPRVWEKRYFALREMGDARRARETGEEALRLAPGNLTVRAALAEQLASEDGAAAERHARRVLEELERVKIRRAVPLEQYRKVSGTLRAQAHTALGLVHFRRGDAAGALRELETAEREAPEPDAALSLRLGRLYAAMGRREEARKRLRVAAEARDGRVAEMGRAALAELDR